MTRWIRTSKSLSVRLKAGPLPAEIWVAIGGTLRRFQDHGIHHADLNADNVLIDEAGVVHLIDFDKSRSRAPAASWQRAMILRLRRSLRKKRAKLDPFHYDDARDWPLLLAGIRTPQQTERGVTAAS